jgi:transposase-like protein
VDAAIVDGSYETFIKPPAVADLEDAGERFFPLDFAALVHEESSLLAKTVRSEALSSGANIVIDSVLSEPDAAVELGDQLEKASYQVDVVDVEVPYEVSLARIAERWRSDAPRVPPVRMRAMAAPKKYSDELRERARRMALQARRDPATAAGALKRVADQLGIHPEALRTWVKSAEVDGGRLDPRAARVLAASESSILRDLLPTRSISSPTVNRKPRWEPSRGGT